MPRSYRLIALLFGLAGLVMAGCSLTPGGDLDSTSFFVEDIEERRAAWDEEGITSYQLLYDRLFEGQLYEQVSVTVRQDTIAEARFSGQPVSQEGLALTIDDMYEEMLAITNQSGRGSFGYDFDDNLPFPDFYRVSPTDALPATGIDVSQFVIPEDSE